MPKKMKKRFYLDYRIVVPYFILCILGIIMVYSAGSYRLQMQGLAPGKEAIKQTVFLFVSFCLLAIVYKMKTNMLQNKKIVMSLVVVTTVMLILTRFTGLGQEVNGAKGWLKLGSATFQPAEFLKIVLVWYLAFILSRRQTLVISYFQETIKRPLYIVFGLILLVLIQPDTGNALILSAIVAVMVFASGIDSKFFVIFSTLALMLSAFFIKVIEWTNGKIFPARFQYIYHRFAVFKNPFLDYSNAGYQLANSYYAIYHGGWFGVGLGNSVQKKGFLPEAQTDFIFSVLVEELGVVTGIIVLILLFFMILRIFSIGIKATTPFNSLLCIGVGGMLLIQVFVNLGGISGIIPLTGVTFPFLSQGGSSLIVNSVAIGLVLNVSAEEKKKEYGELII